MMTKSEHTTAPWFVINHKGSGTSIQNRKEGGGHLIAENVYKGDADLIAAAPYLLAALELILMTHDLSCKGEDCQISGIDLARVAIAKARGEQ